MCVTLKPNVVDFEQLVTYSALLANVVFMEIWNDTPSAQNYYQTATFSGYPWLLWALISPIFYNFIYSRIYPEMDLIAEDDFSMKYSFKTHLVNILRCLWSFTVIWQNRLNKWQLLFLLETTIMNIFHHTLWGEHKILQWPDR